jgi:hypothetical protein
MLYKKVTIDFDWNTRDYYPTHMRWDIKFYDETDKLVDTVSAHKDYIEVTAERLNVYESIHMGHDHGSKRGNVRFSIPLSSIGLFKSNI